MILSPVSCESYDRCRRKWQMGQQWELARIRPLPAVYESIRHALEMPACEHPEEHAYSHFIRQAGDRGIYTTRPDPYQIMQHHAHLAGILALALRRPKDGPRHRPRPIEVTAGVQWQADSYLIGPSDSQEAGGPSGGELDSAKRWKARGGVTADMRPDIGQRLERFVLVDHWDDDRQMSELHSWRTIGDVCMLNLPMTIRVLVIGRHVGGRRHGHWTRARQHPYTKKLQFRRKGDPKAGSGTEGWQSSWKQVWREDMRTTTAQQWLEGMATDRVLTEAAFELHVRVPEARARERVREDVVAIGREMERASGRRGLFPMNRSACDWPMPCPYQVICFSPSDITPELCGIFKRREDTP